MNERYGIFYSGDTTGAPWCIGYLVGGELIAAAEAHNRRDIERIWLEYFSLA